MPKFERFVPFFCPITRQKLKIWPEAVPVCQKKIADGQLRFGDASLVSGALTDVFLREDGLVFYLAIDDIPILLPGKGIAAEFCSEIMAPTNQES